MITDCQTSQPDRHQDPSNNGTLENVSNTRCFSLSHRTSLYFMSTSPLIPLWHWMTPPEHYRCPTSGSGSGSDSTSLLWGISRTTHTTQRTFPSRKRWGRKKGARTNENPSRKPEVSMLAWMHDRQTSQASGRSNFRI